MLITFLVIFAVCAIVLAIVALYQLVLIRDLKEELFSTQDSAQDLEEALRIERIESDDYRKNVTDRLFKEKIALLTRLRQKDEELRSAYICLEMVLNEEKAA